MADGFMTLRAVRALALLAMPVFAPPALSADWRHEVVRGDTLIALTELYLRPERSWRDLQRLNGVREPRRLAVGKELRIPEEWLRLEPTQAEVTAVGGEVAVSDAAGVQRRAAVGDRLRAGDRVRTGSPASLQMRTNDGVEVDVAPGTDMTLRQLGRYPASAGGAVQIELQRGTVEPRTVAPANGPRRIEIRTPTATLGVRGTEFRARHEDDATTRVEVLKGSVSARASGQERLVGAGMASLARPGAAFIEPRALLPAPPLAALAVRQGRPVQLSWPATAEATGYRLRLLARDGTLLVDERVVEPRFDWAGASTGRYRIGVRAVDSLGFEGIEGDAAFDVAERRAGPAPPFPQAPADQAELAAGEVTFQWQRIQPDLRYRLQVAATPDFAAPIADLADSDPPAENFVQRRVLLPPGRWYWRLASISSDETVGEFGPPRTLVITGAR